MKKQHPHQPKRPQGRPEGISLTRARGDELWQWVKSNWKEGGLTLVDRGDLAKPIHAALEQAGIEYPPTIESLKSSLAGQFNGGRTIAKTTIQGLALMCSVNADDLRKGLEERTALPMPARSPEESRVSSPFPVKPRPQENVDLVWPDATN